MQWFFYYHCINLFPQCLASTPCRCSDTLKQRYEKLLGQKRNGLMDIKTGLVILLALVISACSTNTPVTDRNSDLTQGNVQMNLVVGETTKSDVIENFGSPNVTTRDGAGQEVWSYQRSAQVSESSSKSNAWSLLLIGANGSSTGLQTNSRMMTLIIKFDNNNVVSDFRSRSSDF